MSTEVADILWQLSFWILVLLTVLPFPFKMKGYITGEDKSPLIVKVDECFGVFLTWIGLVGFYAFLFGEQYLTPTLWYIWLIVTVSTSLTAIFWSPKMAYAQELLGRKTFLITYWLTVVLYTPMLVAVYLNIGAT